MSRWRRTLGEWAELASVCVLLLGCAAVYPEVATTIRPAPVTAKLVPEPPHDLLYLRFHGAVIPKRTLDGRAWDEVGGKAPDPFAVLYLDGKELFRTPVQPNTLEPRWPTAVRANYRVPRGAVLKVELWDRNNVQNRPICLESIEHVHDDLMTGVREIQCATGAKVWLTVQHAHARYGLGFWYELRPEEVVVTRVLTESPASRAGIAVGQRMLKIGGKDVRLMEEGEVQSLVNTHASTGLSLMVSDASGTRELELREGPIYPLANESITVD